MGFCLVLQRKMKMWMRVNDVNWFGDRVSQPFLEVVRQTRGFSAILRLVWHVRELESSRGKTIKLPQLVLTASHRSAACSARKLEPDGGDRQKEKEQQFYL